MNGTCLKLYVFVYKSCEYVCDGERSLKTSRKNSTLAVIILCKDLSPKA